MGVTGLWRLIEPAGKPVPVETLENKVLAVDISIWLHQMVKGYQDAKGAPLPNAHLMGLFQRLCKLLYFRIKPVFVFDGGFPDLKRETIAKRQDHKSKYNSQSERIKRELALLLSKKTAINSLLGKQSPLKNNTHLVKSNNDDDDLFKLPALPQKEDSDSESEEESSSSSVADLHSVDVESTNFKNLPIKEKYDLLVELKETRKMNSWGKLHEIPKKSDSFSDFQMQRLLKRRKVQECLEETEKEMGETGMSLNELESLLNEEGIDTKVESLPSRRIASNENSRYVLINDLKKALEDAKNRKKAEIQPGTSTENEENTVEHELLSPVHKETPKRDELDNDLEKAIKMSLECVSECDTSVCTKTDDSWTSFITESDYSDSEEEDGFEQPDMTTVKAYIMQYSDFTHKAIDDIIASKNHEKAKPKNSNINQILEEINNDQSVIVDNINLSSDEDDKCNKTNIDKESVNIQNQDIIQRITPVEDIRDSLSSDDNVNRSQASVICVNNSLSNVITLDTSIEEEMNQIKQLDSATSISPNMEENTDSSDDDFEEVIDLENNEANKPVVELTLNMGKVPDNDIFADIFAGKNNDKSTENIKINSTTTENMLSNVDEIVEENLESEDICDDSAIQHKDFVSTNTSIDVTNIANTEIANKLQVEKEKIFLSTAPTNTAIHVASTDIVNKLQVEKENIEKELNKEIKKPKEFISTENLNTMVEEMQNKEQGLLHEKSRLDRIGRNITEEMTKEAQELLQIFGIPYIIAPMEAEAQCAFLESAKLTDGTITDDSDIWLFGGRTVYKNFFNQKKHVLQFLAERIEKSFNLTREQLVLLALLVGSDYTTGVTGVGPVTALEILASFPFSKKHFTTETSKQAQYAHVITGLQEFKQWVRSGKRTDNTTLKKKLKNVDLSEDFPSIRVVQAYLEPNIEKSEEKFTWGEIDITILRDYTKVKFGWSQNKLDEILKPVLKRMLDCKTQKSVQDYFKRKVELQSLEDKMSKRVKAAVQKMGPEVLKNDNIEENGKRKKKRMHKKRALSKDEQKNDLSNSETVAGPSKTKQKKNGDEGVLKEHSVKILQVEDYNSTGIEINISKSDRVQEIIPQREKDKQSLLQNKLKAIEIFRKTKIDRQRKPTKRRAVLPKEKAELSESSDSN